MREALVPIETDRPCPPTPLLDDADDAAIVSLLVSSANRGRPQAAAAWEALLVDFGGLAGLSRADPNEIEENLRRARVPRAEAAALLLAAAFELGRRTRLAESLPPDRIVECESVARWARPRIGRLVHEELWLLALDGRSRLRGARKLAQGGLHGLGVRIPDVLRTALRMGASGFVLVHNHPSGDATPSPEDVTFTRSVATAAASVGLPMLDHVIVAGDTFARVELA